jgi:uncharacterized cupin superfamily protein
MTGMRVFNLNEPQFTYDETDPEPYRAGMDRFGPKIGASRLGGSIYELPPGQSVCPYHYETGEEEWLLVLVGHPTLRMPDGEHVLRPWDTVFFPAGEDGAHKVTNATDETVRVAMWSNRADPNTSVYPDSGKVGAWPPGKLFRLADAVEYFDGEV